MRTAEFRPARPRRAGGCRASRCAISLRGHQGSDHHLQFKPGECINEASVSALLGFGRTPVHQAIDRLMLEEMVEVIPRKGVIVKPVILHDVLQMIDVRMINETQCARLAAERADDSHVQSMSQVLDRARKAISERDIHVLMKLDREFHLLLANASKNFELAEILRKLNERSLRFWFISFTTPDHHYSFQQQHEALFEAIRAHDADKAESAMRVHIEAFRKSVACNLWMLRRCRSSVSCVTASLAPVRLLASRQRNWETLPRKDFDMTAHGRFSAVRIALADSL